MRYQVPQFIEIEDKIFGPLTLKQFIYLAGGAGLSLAFFTLLPIYIALIFIIPVGALALALAFYKVNGRPFIEAAEHAFGYFFGHKLYLWKQRNIQQTNYDTHPAASAQPVNPALLNVPKLSESKLKDLTWSLNIKEQERAPGRTPAKEGFQI